MHTLPLTCNQLCVLLLPAIFVIGIALLLTQSWHPFNYIIILGIALVTLPTFAGFLYLCVWVTENVRCKCE